MLKLRSGLLVILAAACGKPEQVAVDGAACAVSPASQVACGWIRKHTPNLQRVVFVDHGLRVGAQDLHRDLFSIVAMNDASSACAMQFYNGGEGGAFALDHTVPVHVGWCALTPGDVAFDGKGGGLHFMFDEARTSVGFLRGTQGYYLYSERCAGEQRAAPPPTLLGDYVMPNCAGG